MKKYDLLIIGGGCAGLAAAISAFEQGITKIALIERNEALIKASCSSKKKE